MQVTREMARQLKRDNLKHPARLAQIPEDQWPNISPQPIMCLGWRSFYSMEMELLSFALIRLQVGFMTMQQTPMRCFFLAGKPNSSVQMDLSVKLPDMELSCWGWVIGQCERCVIVGLGCTLI